MTKKKRDWSTYMPKTAWLVLGEHYIVYGRYCRFIKVTKKGFNFLIEDANKCMLSHHIYDKRFWNKPLPNKMSEVKTVVNKFANIRHVPKQVSA